MGFTLRNIYFAPDFLVASEGEDLQIYLQTRSTCPHAKLFNTSIIDLKKPQDELRSKISKTYLYEINRARKSDNVINDFFILPDQQQVEEFIEFFNRFARSKKLTLANEAKLHALSKSRALLITKASSNSTVMAMHAYICDSRRARMLHSASNPILRSTEQRSRLGRVNKLMHWECILHLKNAGFHEYDLGGISDTEKLQSNSAFKRSFGGNDVTEFNAVVGVSHLGKFLAWILRKLFNR